MKNKCLYLLGVIVGLFSMTALCSCGDDSVGSDDYAEGILGMWELQRNEGVEEGDRYVEDYANDPKYKNTPKEYLVVQQDHVYYMGRPKKFSTAGSWHYGGVWSISEENPEKLMLSDKECTIKSCSKSELVLFIQLGSTWNYNSHYKRVNKIPGFTPDERK